MNTETDMTCEEAAAGIAALISRCALRFSFEHIPTTPKEAQIKWSVTVEKAGQLQRFNYSAGIAHLPCYAALKGPKNTLHNEAIIPNAADVLHCLALDAEAINYATFEQWADEFGYDTDSRAAERSYQECLRAGLFLRAVLGEKDLETLQTLSRFM